MPPIELTEQKINELISAPKTIPPDYLKHLKTKQRGYSECHEECNWEIDAPDGGKFRIILRKNLINPLDFSVILGYIPMNRIKVFRIRRYNGCSHEHTNTIEKISFKDFHIHVATERYQEIGSEIDKYAEPTSSYSTFNEALDTMLKECNFITPNDQTRPRLFS